MHIHTAANYERILGCQVRQSERAVCSGDLRLFSMIPAYDFSVT